MYGRPPPSACQTAFFTLAVRLPHRRLPCASIDLSTPWRPKCPSPSRRCGEPLPGAERLQAVFGNSRVLDTLDPEVRLRVVAFESSTSLVRAVGHLERAVHGIINHFT